MSRSFANPRRTSTPVAEGEARRHAAADRDHALAVEAVDARRRPRGHDRRDVRELDGPARPAAGSGARRGCRRGRGPSRRGAGGRRSPRRASGSRKRETSSSPPTRMRSAEPMSLARSPRSAARSRSIVTRSSGLSSRSVVSRPRKPPGRHRALADASRRSAGGPRATGPWITKSMSHEPPPMLIDG